MTGTRLPAVNLQTGEPAGRIRVAWNAMVKAAKFFVTVRWSDAPEGFAFDPIPNPKRFLVVRLGFGPVGVTFSLDLK